MTKTISLAALACLIAGPAFAHAGITPSEAVNGTTVKLAISIPHGCDGAATDTVIIKLPEGFVSAKPMVKAGWTVEITKGDYAKSYELHGSAVTSGALEVKWSGGSVPDDQYDEFIVRGSVQGFDAAAALPFAVTQLCGTASVAWDQIAAEGQDAHSLEHPAPVLKVTPAAAEEHGHGHGHDHAAAAAPAAVTLGDLELTGPFTRATLPNAPVAGGFVTITNKGAEADKLLSASSPISDVVQLHEMKMEGDVMKMNEVAGGIDIPAGGTVSLAPGGLHIMFMGLKEPLVEGGKVPVTLTFEKAGTIEIELSIEGIAAKQAAGEHAHHSDAAHGHDHGNGMAVDQAGLSDVDAITAMQKAMFDRPESPLTMGAIVVVGDYAITGWAQDGTGGRALLRKTAKGWGIHLCSGESLKDTAALVGMGVPEDVAKSLTEQLSAAEAQLDPMLVAEFAKFDGVMMVDESLL
jgi:uncharacterized protein YcnI/copper(I)-binding protein